MLCRFMSMLRIAAANRLGAIPLPRYAQPRLATATLLMTPPCLAATTPVIALRFQAAAILFKTAPFHRNSNLN